MIISGNQVKVVLQSCRQEYKLAEDNKKPLALKDRVDISFDAALRQKTLEVIHDLPDVRENRVNEIKNQPFQKVDSYDIADKLIQRMLVDDIYGKNY